MDIHQAWSGFHFGMGLLILVAYFVLDAMYAYYTIKVTEKRPVSAATIGALMHFIIAFGVLSYVHSFLYVFPIVIGSWLGTYSMVRYEQQLAHPKKKVI